MTEKQTKFKQLMLSGHGRCFYILADDSQPYKDIVMYGCLHDISFDMQCEGTRGIYMYNLARQFDDEEEFLRAAAEKFLTPKVNVDWHTFNHLCDFIRCFAADGNFYAENILDKKYSELYDLIMKTRRSVKLNNLTSSFEYLAIVIMQHKGLPRLEKLSPTWVRTFSADITPTIWNCIGTSRGFSNVQKTNSAVIYCTR